MDKEELREYLEKQLTALEEENKQKWLSEYEEGYIRGQINVVTDILETIG